ncbi:hypothetical protein CONLIGDRAFT_678193 [Coniochaeta ligniaria NRRL 30616]|uniref:DNA damage-responsive protein 48 n=1 Tax=Coniochaeta ligniaria NRRL 30616 TaxID=1408157 RepID=A0A1J7IVK1_9PEZI|nr:hypothetical protein CONLIGDRAFT_678193 [Coniochaeta ligniaria NRRL 30616]
MDYINKLSGNNGNNMNQTTQNQQQPSSGGNGGGFMDKLSGLAGGSQNNNSTQAGQTSSGGGFMDKLNGMAGGGRESEKNEDVVDKGVDWVQQNVLGQGPQDNESAIEQAKDEQISDYIRGAYKSATGSDIPIKDKERQFGQ